jgi:predicted DNA-binding ribbon-helix-helix protein
MKRSIMIAGHKTSVSLEESFWKALKEIALNRKMTLSALVASIDGQRVHGNLSSCLRLFVLDFYQPSGRKVSHPETHRPTLRRRARFPTAAVSR